MTTFVRVRPDRRGATSGSSSSSRRHAWTDFLGLGLGFARAAFRSRAAAGARVLAPAVARRAGFAVDRLAGLAQARRRHAARPVERRQRPEGLGVGGRGGRRLRRLVGLGRLVDRDRRRRRGGPRPAAGPRRERADRRDVRDRNLDLVARALPLDQDARGTRGAVRDDGRRVVLAAVAREDCIVGAEEQLGGRFVDRVIIIGVRDDVGRRRRRRGLPAASVVDVGLGLGVDVRRGLVVDRLGADD